ncbi:hypothetical protein QJQ45_023812 [Haematococcus lacustris]|nr:hypothetical protein QJQ45_023812 [Haematococcus lacustris]
MPGLPVPDHSSSRQCKHPAIMTAAQDSDPEQTKRTDGATTTCPTVPVPSSTKRRRRQRAGKKGAHPAPSAAAPPAPTTSPQRLAAGGVGDIGALSLHGAGLRAAPLPLSRPDPMGRCPEQGGGRVAEGAARHRMPGRLLLLLLLLLPLLLLLRQLLLLLLLLLSAGVLGPDPREEAVRRTQLRVEAYRQVKAETAAQAALADAARKQAAAEARQAVKAVKERKRAEIYAINAVLKLSDLARAHQLLAGGQGSPEGEGSRPGTAGSDRGTLAVHGTLHRNARLMPRVHVCIFACSLAILAPIMILTRIGKSGAVKVRAEASSHRVVEPSLQARQVLDRRSTLIGIASCGVASVVPGPRNALAAADLQTVGAYLPPAGVGDFVRFTPAKDKTPAGNGLAAKAQGGLAVCWLSPPWPWALRAGTIKPDSPYTFILPPGFKELRISNTQNGNFCQPRCAEPWTEVVYEDGKVGKVQLMAVPLLKLTNVKNPSIAQLGTPAELLPRIGPYITGSYYDEDSLQAMSTLQPGDGLTYYEYELNSLDAASAPRSLTVATAKGEVLYLLVCTASEKQWKGAEATLRTVAESFRA